MSELASERVIIAAPMSFQGSAERIWRLSVNTWIQIAILIPLIIVVWFFVLNWYLLFGFLVVPYRLIRRSQRKKKKQELQHRELIEKLS